MIWFPSNVIAGMTPPKSLKPPKGTNMSQKKPYGLGRFLLDLFLIAITGGLWLIWMIFKFIRKG